MAKKQSTTLRPIQNPPAAEVIALARSMKRVIPNAELSEPCITIKIDGEFVCNCQTFLTNAMLFDGGSCPHTRHAQLADQLHDLAADTPPEVEPVNDDWGAWIDQQAAIAEQEVAIW